MKQLRNTVIRAGLGALYFSGAHYLLRPILSGVGAIFMLHHVRPRRDGQFQPNRHLEVAPEFLRAMLAHLRARGIDIITMDEVHQRLIERKFSRRFACFTFDDGYRDNRDFALPVMREFDAPFTLYVASDFAEGSGRLWWIALEMAIARASFIEVRIGDAPTRLDTGTPAAKQAAFDRLHDWLRTLPGNHEIQREVGALCARHGVDEAAICRDLCMSWDELKRFAQDSLVERRRALRHPLQSRQRAGGDRRPRDGGQPRADRERAGPPRAAPCLPLWRQDRGRHARIRAGAHVRIQDRGDDTAGHGVSRKAPTISPRYRGSRSMAIIRTCGSCRS